MFKEKLYDIISKIKMILMIPVIAIQFIFFPLPSFAADTAGKAEVKEVCHDKMKDGKPVTGKDGKVVQECKKIKVHKKLEGTDIPPAKK